MSLVFSIDSWKQYALASRTICFLIDSGILIGSFLLATQASSFGALPFVFTLQIALFRVFGLHHIVWRYIGFHDLRRFFEFSIVSTSMLIIFDWILPGSLQHLGIPASVSLSNGFFVFSGLVSVRVMRRAIDEHQTVLNHHQADPKVIRTLLVGAGSVGVMASVAFRKSRNKKLDLIGFVDDDLRKKDSFIQQLPVLGNMDELSSLVKKYQIKLVAITIAKISGKEIRRIVEICKQIPVEVRVVPGYGDIFQGHFSVSQLREIKIEDLLKREPVDLDLESIGCFLKGKKILVTGAGGSIGSELARQVARFEPSSLILLDLSEAALFEISQELGKESSIKLVSCVGNCINSQKIRAVFEKYQPEIVLHAAAYKHVSLMEQNPFEAIECNVLGTKAVAEAAGAAGVNTFVLVSTDKAVKPSSIMGASKRLAELVVSESNQRFDTCYITVRFGNVLGSSGSVVPIFKKQIAKGGPITVTDPEMTRYFMTIPEACQLILQAACVGQGGELFVLDMGEPVKILDLAKDMIRLSGLKPEEDIPIVFSGMKPGEKLAEQLYTTDEISSKTKHARIFLGRAISPLKPDSELWDELNRICSIQDESLLRNFLSRSL